MLVEQQFRGDWGDRGGPLPHATIGSARALMRDDRSRIAPSCKADLAPVDLKVPQVRPVPDRLRSFVYHAADRVVRDVFVERRQAVADRKVLTLDQDGAADRLAGSQQRMPDLAPGRTSAAATPTKYSPLSLALPDFA